MTNKEQPKVFLVGNNDDWKVDLRRGQPSLPWGHREVSDISLADICFWWAEKRTITGFSGVQLGLAISRALPIKIGAINRTTTNWIDQSMGSSFLSTYKLKVVYGSDIIDSYQRAMSDIDVRMPARFIATNVPIGSTCLACNGSFYKGEAGMYNPAVGSYHADCHKQTFDPKNISTAMFNASLIDTLRKENAELEEKLRASHLHK